MVAAVEFLAVVAHERVEADPEEMRDFSIWGEQTGEALHVLAVHLRGEIRLRAALPQRINPLRLGSVSALTLKTGGA